MLFCSAIVIDTYKKHRISGTLSGAEVSTFLNLRDGRRGTLIPFEFNYERRVCVGKGLFWDKNEICEPFSGGHFSNRFVIPSHGTQKGDGKYACE